MEGHYYYVCVILDIFSRMAIAHKCSRKNSVQLITATFKTAVEQCKPKAGLIFHSDRGAQYTSHRFRQLLRDHAAKQSFSNSGKPHDNAVAEEELYRRDYPSEAAFKKGVDSYIEFYKRVILQIPAIVRETLVFESLLFARLLSNFEPFKF